MQHSRRTRPVNSSATGDAAPDTENGVMIECRGPAGSGEVPPPDSDDLFLGVDFGTSGARATVIDSAGDVQLERKESYPEGDLATGWASALFSLLSSVPEQQRSRLKSMAIDGTSATLLLLDRDTGKLLAPPKMYHEAQPPAAVRAAQDIAPPGHTATASTSSLCKLIAWGQAGTLMAAPDSACVLHQADWLASLLTGVRDCTDANNALKMGFDPAPEVAAYPAWLLRQPYARLLPSRVLMPGQPGAVVDPDICERAGLPRDCVLCGGTTDSIAAFIAAGVSRAGQAVSSLGSSLAIKLISTTRVDDAAYGVYSHRLGEVWLVGGSSNVGCAVLRQHFTNFELEGLTFGVDPGVSTGLDYYPLPGKGERFPVNDPELMPRLSPRPLSDSLFLQGIMEGVATIEARGYELLAALGATPVSEVLSAGGGSVNAKWTAIRQNIIGVPVSVSPHSEASYGAALLARSSFAESAPDA